jgi:phosphatidate cytidylyltransferase
MALNKATFRTRALTALFFCLIMLAGMLIGPWSFFILFSIIHFGCWSEFQKLVGRIDPEYATISPFHKYGVRIAGWCIMLYFTNDAFNIVGIRLHALGWWLGLTFMFVLPIVELLFAKNIQLKNIGHSLFGLIYLSFSWGLMMDLRVMFMGVEEGNERVYVDTGWYIPLVLIIAMWINDTMAYLVGSWIGRTPFSSISPKKTWEGTAGGAILSIIIISVGMKLIMSYSNVWNWIFISAIASVMGVLGDLLESKLKRLADVKDSGEILPGHGGFLDRFDSLLLATPFVWVYVTFMMR